MIVSTSFATNLNLDQWVVCILVGLLIIPVSEIRKIVIKKPLDEVPTEAAPVAAAAAA